MADFSRITTDPPLAEMRRMLRGIAPELSKGLQRANKDVAGIVAEKTRGSYASYYQQGSGAGARSIRARATQTSSAVAIGGAKAPYLPGQNFGSNRLRRFAPKATPDRFLYTTVEKERDAIIERHNEEVDKVMRPVFPDGAL